MDAFKLFLTQKRFDLIFKYLYVRTPSLFVRNAYLESIRSFNNFHEENPSDGIPKESSTDFINSFNVLIDKIKINGFDSHLGLVPVGLNGEVSDGAHRLAVCAALRLNIEISSDEHLESYPYVYFKNNGMDSKIMDYGALEYVKLNPNAYIVNLHSVTDPKYDTDVVNVLEKYGFVYYSKNVYLNFNGYVNLKKISYCSFWEKENEWAGNVSNKYLGAQEHAKKSMGNDSHPLRVFVFVCDDINKVVKAKQEIRAIYNIGNYSVHINDTHEEAIWLAETYFNDNSLYWLNNAPFEKTDEQFDGLIEIFKERIKESGCDLNSVCCVGSTPLNVFFSRKSEDIDFLTVDNNPIQEDVIISNHDSQLKYYKHSKDTIITDPRNYFYYHGVKFITLEQLFCMKIKRHEYPKDYKDLYKIILLLSPKLKMLDYRKKQ